MSRRCELTGKTAQVGHKVSHSNIKTKRRFLPNLLNVTLISDAPGRPIRLRISSSALRTVDHRGGLDAFLIKAHDDEFPREYASSSGKSARCERDARHSRNGSLLLALLISADSPFSPALRTAAAPSLKDREIVMRDERQDAFAFRSGMNAEAFEHEQQGNGQGKQAEKRSRPSHGETMRPERSDHANAFRLRGCSIGTSSSNNSASFSVMAPPSSSASTIVTARR